HFGLLAVFLVNIGKRGLFFTTQSIDRMGDQPHNLGQLHGIPLDWAVLNGDNLLNSWRDEKQ
ncbi:MAG: hypothetical protein ACYS76_15775, partial [Planctomycetota bacterium]